MVKPPKRRSPNVPQNQPQLMMSHLPFPVVGIGASAGGLQALLKFFEHMPQDNGMAFVIIMHLSPDHESSADRILQGVTNMPVQQVSKPVPIEKNSVYIISPAHLLSMNDGHLRVRKPDPSRPRHAAIDLFFRDLADVHKDRAYCLVLSGTGSDGASGLSRIKEQNGITMAQSPDDAEFDGMPSSAIATGMVDLVLPVAEMPQKLMELWRNASSIHMPVSEDPEISAAAANDATDDGPAAESALRAVLAQLFNRTGYDFAHYKRATVLRRIERRMQVNAQPDMPAYLEYLQSHPEETKPLLDDMFIGVTNFFRDREAFEALERDVIPQLFRFGMDFPGDEKAGVRVWSAGTSTGEEAFSLAMLLADQVQLEAAQVKVQVFGTDIDERAIGIGRAGIYPASIITDVAPPRLRQYFIKNQTHYKVKKEIREKILFAQHSLLRDPPFSHVHLICCRNLLIYLDRDAQRKILEMFHFALRPGGYLFLGSSESADICADLFTPVDKKNRIYRAKNAPAPARHVPVVPSANGSRRLDIPAPVMQPRKQTFAEVHQRVLEQYAPPSVIVDTDADIVHMSDRAGHFLRFMGGEPSRNLLAVVAPELRLELRTALFQAQQTGKSVEARRVRVRRGDRSYHVHMVAKPFKDETAGSEFILVMFDEVEDAVTEAAGQKEQQEQEQDRSKDTVLTLLEEELQRTKLHLQNTLEQSGTSHEELRASNEELQAINEELRSATEELETSKEELQSINEELITVNYELKSKVEETGKINDDLQNLITSTDIATVFVDRGMRIKWFTPRATQIFSMLPVDSGRSLLDITHRLDYPDLADDATLVFESLKLVEREVRSSDGRWYIARLLPYRTSDDHIEGAVLTFIDISGRRAAEAELRLGEERMRLVAESTEDYAIIVQDTEGMITGWNRGAELIFGYSKAEAEGQPCHLIFTPEDRAAGVPEIELRRARESGRAEDERWHMRKDGSRFYCSGVVNPLQNDHLRGYVKIARDLTDRQQRHDEQAKRLVETQNTIQLKDEFFAVMSHELKHPLNLIQLNAELLGRLPITKRTPTVAKAVRTINEAVSSQAQIIDDLLDVSRVHTGKLKLDCHKVDLGNVLRDVLEVVHNDEPERTLTLHVEESDIQRLLINVDSTRLEQIIWNLLNNALKFTPMNGEITISATRSGNWAQLDVSDTGEGIAPEYLDKVFDLFGQADTQHVRIHRDGLGIGLSLVRQLVEAHGGDVQVRSDGIDKGSAFTVWLPLYLEQDEQTEDLRRSVPTGRLHDLRVLLVDDSLEVLEVMTMLLETEEALVTSFSSAPEALAAAQAQEQVFDLIISDIGMPTMDGHQLIAALRQLPAFAQLPAIALTGYGGNQDIDKALRAGFNQHLSKPVSYESLISTIERLALCKVDG
ncbi:chemotaxis protein CheB [Halopseudomonas laoshanensis]|uniref:chemotaxis protein CheB n=1 Tax=Halopseudomonas laoshanensis TaxID=2268758 RepID=UPI003736A2CB